MKKRILSLALALIMIISLLPVTTFAAPVRYSLQLLYGTDHVVKVWASNEGETTYTKNKEVTLTDSAGAQFTGWAQEIVEITDETNQEWNTKFYYDTTTQKCVLVLNGAKLDSYNNEANTIVSSSYAIYGLSTNNNYDLKVVVKADSTLESATAILGNGSVSVKIQSLEVISEGSAKLTCNNKGYFAHLQGNYVKLNANIDFNGNGNSFLYLNKGGAYYQIDGGTLKINAYRFTSHSNSSYPVYVNGGSFDVTTTNRFAYSPIVFADGLCYTAKNASGTNLNLSSGNSSKRVIVNTYGDHTLSGEVTDCTAGGTCSVCNSAVPGKAAHEIDVDDGNCVTSITCKYCDVVMAEGAAAHVPGEPSGDCTVAVKCVNCNFETTPAKAHTPKEPVIENETDVDYDWVVYCEECGKEVSREKLSKLCPHTDSTLVEQNDATCTEDGWALWHCNEEDCGEDYEIVLPATGHNHVTTTVVSPDMYNKGYTVYTCYACGDTYNGDYVNRLSYMFAIGKVRYATFADALAEAKANDVIRLDRDVNDGAVLVVDDKEVTIDLNGHIYTAVSNAAGSAALVVGTNANVTLSSGVGTGKLQIRYSARANFATLVNNQGVLYVDSVILGGNSLTNKGSYVITNSGTIHLEDGTKLEFLKTANNLDNSGTVYKDELVELAIPDTHHWSIEGKLELHSYELIAQAATVYEPAHTLNLCVCGDNFKNNYIGAKLPVKATNGNKIYASVQDAIDDATPGDTIKITTKDNNAKGFVVDRDLTIDLNGFIHTVETPAENAVMVIKEGVKVLLTSSGTTAKLQLRYSNRTAFETIIKNAGELTVENVIVYGSNLPIKTLYAITNESEEGQASVTLGDDSSVAARTEDFLLGGNGTVVDNSKVNAPLATGATLDKVTIEKAATAGGAITLHPDSNVTYTITITNGNDTAISVNVTDTLPKNMVLVSGCETINGSELFWKVSNIQPGETRTITYVAKNTFTLAEVKNAKNDIVLKGTAPVVVEKAGTAPANIWVLETFNKEDIRKIEMGIDAMVTANLTAKNSSKQQMNRIPLVNMMYYVGFSAAPGFGTSDPDAIFTMIFDQAGQGGGGSSSGGVEDVVETASNLLDKVVPTLYGGTTVSAEKDAMFRGDRATEVKVTDLISGDVIFVNNDGATTIYIYDGTYLVELAQTYVTTKIVPETVLSTLPQSDKYVVIRVSIGFNITFALKEGEYFNDADKEGWTELEKQLIATAESYLLRGDRNQYTDDMTGISLFRWQTSTKQPEDCTVDQYGYTNCAAFTHDVHWATYGISPKAKNTDGSSVGLYTTENLASTAARGWNAETMTGSNASTIFYCRPQVKDENGVYQSTMTAEEQAATKELIISLLRPGDIICIRRTSGSGHAMLYAGNGTIIHSSGSSYSDSNKTDTHEATIRFRMVEDLFQPDIYAPASYVFNLVSFSIVRPQNMYPTTAVATENTLNRVENMKGVIAEKITSTAMGKTVNCGDEITYTFHIFNTNKTEKTFAIRDVLSEYVTFVSATDNGVVDGSNISWDITVPAETRISVSYTVKVNEGLANYTSINGGNATINGVKHRCPNTYVANTLTTEQQQALIAAIETVKGMDITGLNSVDIAELIYKTAFGVEDLFGEKVTNFSMLLDGGANQNKSNPVLGEDNVGVFNDTKYWSSTSSNTTNRNAVSFMDSNTSNAALMVAPGMWGGGLVYNSTYNKNGRDENSLRYLDVAGKTLRSRYYWEKDLVIGDIYLLKGSTSEQMFIYIGNDTFVSIGDDFTVFTEKSVAERFEYTPHDTWKKHCVLRPSIVLDI